MAGMVVAVPAKDRAVSRRLVGYDARVKQLALADTTITMLGLGDVSLATSEARNVPASDVQRALHEALSLGITLVDCAPDAESVCGEAVRALRLRDRVIVATRIATSANVRELQARVEDSLRGTRLEALPLAWLPSQLLASRAWLELQGACLRLVREGKVQRWGIEVLGDERARLATPPEPPPTPKPSSLVSLFEAVAAPAPPKPAPAIGEPFVAIATTLSLCDRAALPLLEAKLPMLARAPLAGGALAGRLGPGAKLALRDDRGLDDATLERIAVTVAKLARFVRDDPPAARSCDAARAIVERVPRVPNLEAITVAELALRWVIDRGACALPRLHRHEHLAAAIAAASAPPLSAELVARIDELFSPASS